MKIRRFIKTQPKLTTHTQDDIELNWISDGMPSPR